jgi:L-galactose dehydrogenase
MTQITYNKLGKTNLKVSRLGFGCAALGNVYGDVTEDDAIQLVHQAIDSGINCFDTAPFYGNGLSEKRLGQALQGQRPKVILASKAGHNHEGFDFSDQGIRRSCIGSLGRLKTDYLDIFQLHDIEYADPQQLTQEAIPALEKLKQEGQVRFIGVTGYSLNQLTELIQSQSLDLVLSYCHYNLLDQRLNEKLLPTVKTKGLGLINASVTHMGVLTEQGPPDWHPATQEVREASQKAAAYCRQQGSSLSTVALYFALQNPDIDMTLLGVKSETELAQSLQVVSCQLDESVLRNVQTILEPVQNRSWKPI